MGMAVCAASLFAIVFVRLECGAEKEQSQNPPLTSRFLVTCVLQKRRKLSNASSGVGFAGCCRTHRRRMSSLTHARRIVCTDSKRKLPWNPATEKGRLARTLAWKPRVSPGCDIFLVLSLLLSLLLVVVVVVSLLVVSYHYNWYHYVINDHVIIARPLAS